MLPARLRAAAVVPTRSSKVGFFLVAQRIDFIAQRGDQVSVLGPLQSLPQCG
jgi:hypothetical protein